MGKLHMFTLFFRKGCDSDLQPLPAVRRLNHLWNDFVLYQSKAMMSESSMRS